MASPSGGMGTAAKVLLAIGVVVGVLFVGLIAIGLFLGSGTGTVSATSVERGECFADFSQFEADSSGAGEISTVDKIDCEQAHSLEAFYVGPAYEQYTDFPGADELTDVAITSCRQRFERFVNFDWENSELDFWWLMPSPGGWERGDRELACLVGEADYGLTVGTLEDARR